jgi:hypothetical protein
MVILICRIEIQPKNGTLKALTWDYVHECEITSSWEEMTDTAKITLPKSVKLRTADSKGDIDISFAGKNAVFKRGDAIRIYAGYRYNKNTTLTPNLAIPTPTDDLSLRFSGFITHVDPSMPIVISAEDGMYKLKNITIKKYENPKATLKAILTYIIPKDVKWETEDITIGKFKIEDSSVVEVLEYMKKEFGFSSYFLDDVLYVGFQYQTSKIEQKIVDNAPIFHFQHNIIEGKSLVFQEADEIKYNVKAINIKTGNRKHTIEVGDADGEQRTLHFYNADDKDLKALATELLNKMKYTGFRGDFTTFLNPHMKHGDAISLMDDVIPDRNGIYLIKAVNTKFGVSGGRQTITLDRELNTFAK